MVARRIGEFLNQAGFAQARGNYPEVTYWYRINDRDVIFFCVCDFSQGIFIFDRELNEDFKSVYEKFALRGYEKAYKLSIVCTHDCMSARNVMQYAGAYWLVDLSTLNLVIYEDQPGDFCNCKRALEDQLDVIRDGGTKKKAHIFSVSPVNTIIVVLNVIVFIILEMLGDTHDAYFMYEHGAVFAPAVVEEGEFYRLFTAMFLHFGLEHLSGNMMVLFFLGDNVERTLGKLKYVLIYILSGLCASASSLVFNLIAEENAVSAGASGAIFGVIGALLYMVWRNKGRLEDINGFRFTLLALYMLLTGFTSSGVDNVAHVGGFIAGFILSIIFYHKGSIKGGNNNG